MTVKLFIHVLRERWRLIVAAVVLALAAAGAVWNATPHTYTAGFTALVSARAVDPSQSAYDGALLAEQRASSYTALVTSQRVSEQVISRFGYPGTPEQLSERITATLPLNSILITVEVVGPEPNQTADLANDVATVFRTLVDDLERPANTAGIQNVTLQIVQPATVPTVPSSPGLRQVLAIGLLLGLALGLGAALARNAFDSSVKTPEQLLRLTGAPNLGTTARGGDVPRQPLVTFTNAGGSTRSEDFRQMRIGLQSVFEGKPNRVVAVTSAMPGEGKTTILVNIAGAFAAAGQRVLVVDGNLRRPRVASLLGLSSARGLTDVLNRQIDLAGAIVSGPDGSFDVLASGPIPPNPSELLGSQSMSALLTDVRDRYDVILIDTPPLLAATDAAAVGPATDGVVIVSRYAKTTAPQIERAVDMLRIAGTHVLATVLSMIPNVGTRVWVKYRSDERAALPAVPTGPTRPTLDKVAALEPDATMEIPFAVSRQAVHEALVESGSARPTPFPRHDS